MQKHLRLIPLLTVLIAPSAIADEADLLRTAADLKSQTNDKERMDSKGVVKIEISQIRDWLNEAANAIKEEDEEKTRKLFDRVRLQFILIDELVALHAIRTEAKRLETILSKANAKLESDKKDLQQKQDKIRAMKMVESS